MAIAPNPGLPEQVGNTYERKMSPATPGLRGPLRFEEGVATDTDVPNEFQIGINQGYDTAPSRPNHNLAVHTKSAAETMSERAHVGSAAWVEAPTFISEYEEGNFSDYATAEFQEVDRSGSRYQRPNPARVND